jgi:hypothetical protein
MKKLLHYLLFFILLLFCTRINAQNYTAYEFWKMERDSVFNSLKKKQIRGDTLSITDIEFLFNYKARLDNYFNNLDDKEKSLYFRNRTSWEKPALQPNKLNIGQEPDIFTGDKSTFTNYIVSSGFYGYYYGITALYVFDSKLKDQSVLAIPMLTAGVSVLVPLLTIKQESATYSSIKLSRHGKLVGLMHGAAFGLILSDNDGPDGKLIMGLSSLGSISLGYLGYRLERNMQPTPGNAALYSYYGTLMPLEGLALASALEVDDPRVVGFSILVGGAGGYLLADRISKSYSFTPGDITSTKAFTFLNALLGLGLVWDINSRSSDDHPAALMLIPMATTLGGSFISHAWLKNAKLTSQQGRNTALAAGAGVLIGYGVSTLADPKFNHPRYILPYLSGLVSYSTMLMINKKINRPHSLTAENKNKLDFSFMPQNILLNQKYGKIHSSLSGWQTLNFPVISASYNF